VPWRFQLAVKITKAIRHHRIDEDVTCTSMPSRKLEMQTPPRAFFSDDDPLFVEAYFLGRKGFICTEPMQFPDIVSTS
jgi:hypothetical protein